jgi:cation diffusion facilitator CzcD-associated flavoprotein CzcO
MSKLIHTPVASSAQSGASYDVVVMGAGPYGLSTAAHLLGQGLRVAVFGKPMELWRDYMPRGMLLRSYWWATNLSDPQKQFGLARYLQELGQEPFDPVPGDTIAEYGLWFQKHAVPMVDETYIQMIERRDGQFEVTLEDGRVVTCSSVVMAPGLQPYVYRAPEYDHLPQELVTHTAVHRTFDGLAGKRVAIIGGGQSALEGAALAYESGVQVEVIARKSIVWIMEGAALPTNRSLRDRVVAPKAGISPGWFNRIEETFPYGFALLPRQLKDGLLHGVGAHGPKGSSWLRPRLIGKVPLHEQTSVLAAREADDGLLLTLSNQQSLKVDHIILATGYRIDVQRLALLGESILPRIQTYDGAPILTSRFESSVPGLFFVGFSSFKSCGPYYRFVVGTGAAASRVAATVARRSHAGPSL